MPGRAPKQKGTRFEREVVDTLRARGLVAKRVPLSGAAGGDDSGDVKVWLNSRQVCLECKVRASGFKFLYDTLAPEHVDALVVKVDRARPLVVIPLDTLLDWLDINNVIDHTTDSSSTGGF